VVKISQLNNITGKKKVKQLINQLLKFAAKKPIQKFGSQPRKTSDNQNGRIHRIS